MLTKKQKEGIIHKSYLRQPVEHKNFKGTKEGFDVETAISLTEKAVIKEFLKKVDKKIRELKNEKYGCDYKNCDTCFWISEIIKTLSKIKNGVNEQ